VKKKKEIGKLGRVRWGGGEQILEKTLGIPRGVPGGGKVYEKSGDSGEKREKIVEK